MVKASETRREEAETQENLNKTKKLSGSGNCLESSDPRTRFDDWTNLVTFESGQLAFEQVFNSAALSVGMPDARRRRVGGV